MKRYFPAGARILLGLIFLITGLNKLFWFVPVPPMSVPLTSFMNALKATGYFMPFLGIVETALARSSSSIGCSLSR